MTETVVPTRVGARGRARGRVRPFRAVDGEAVTIGRGAAKRHLYVLLGTDDDAIENPAGLSTVDCLDFLLRQARLGDILVAFAFNYDVNMILRDVDPEQLRELWQLGECDVQLDGLVYSLEWIPGKLFSVSVVDPATDRRLRAKVWDTWGFFQASFVKALEQWDVHDDSDESPGTIERMKKLRARFNLEMLDEIRAYNAAECRLLVELMNRVRDALYAVDLRPRSWLGAGSIASALLHKYRVKEQLENRATRSPTLDEDVIMRAYFGGRTEVFQQGIFTEAVALDINSAYPSAAVTLPSTRGEWKRRREYDPDAEYAIWRVRWQLDDGALIAPFPYRKKRAIFYPLAGEGWYHACEIQAAISAFGSDVFDVSTGYVFTPADGSRPLGFVADVFEQRRQMKRDGHPSEKVLKLGINSVYGKLAQGASRKQSGPPFQEYFWAGYITAHTRARMLSAIAQSPGGAIAVATDGLIVAAGHEPDVDVGKGLGQWERTRYRRLFVAQPGMYYAHASRRRIARSRGFFTREINFPALQRTWLDDGPEGMQLCRTHRFVGLGSALLRNDFSIWRTWEDGVRRLSLYSSRKFYGSDRGPARRLYPPASAGAGLSDVYVPKNAAVELDPDDAEWIQGTEQPHTTGGDG